MRMGIKGAERAIGIRAHKLFEHVYKYNMEATRSKTIEGKVLSTYHSRFSTI